MKQHAQAKAWREQRGLTRAQLADLTGYTVAAIYKLEAGYRNGGTGEMHSEWTWQRYRMACAGAEKQLRSGKEFRW